MRLKTDDNQVNYILNKSEIFDYRCISQLPVKSLAPLGLPGHWLFVLEETPLDSILSDFVTAGDSRPVSLVVNQHRFLRAHLLLRAVYVLILANLLVNVIRVSVFTGLRQAMSIFEIMVLNQIYFAIPLWLSSLESIVLILRSLGNAHVVLLSEALNRSTSEFEDLDDVDEFDAAPPPTRDINIPTRKFYYQQAPRN